MEEKGHEMGKLVLMGEKANGCLCQFSHLHAIVQWPDKLHFCCVNMIDEHH